MTVRPDKEKRRGPGRPRSEQAHRSIMESTMMLLIEEGFSNLSIEAVASAAGVGKTTIYRRWSGKTELVIAAMSNFMKLDEVPDTGTIKGDLMAFHMHGGHNFSLRLLAGGGSTLLGTVLSEKERNPELIETFRRLVTDRRRDQFRIVVERAKKRGEIREDTDPDFVGSAIFGSLIARTITGIPVTDSVIEQTIDNLLMGICKQ